MIRQQSECCPGNSSGFTLVELLVSIGVIAVLVALALGIQFKMLASSRNAGCISNLRVLSQACFLYAAEHNNNLPFKYKSGAGWSGYGSPLWYVAVAPYAGIKVTNENYGELKQPGPFKCPADKVPWVGGDPKQFLPSCSYAFPLPLAVKKMDGTPNEDGSYVNLVSRFSQPSQMVMLIDSAFGNVFNSGSFAKAGGAANDPAETGPELVKRHQGHLNAVFADGHCEPIPGDTPSIPADRPHLWGN